MNEKKYQYKLPTQLILRRAQTVDELSENMCIIRNEVLFHFSSFLSRRASHSILLLASCRSNFSSIFAESFFFFRKIKLLFCTRKSNSILSTIFFHHFPLKENWRKTKSIDKSHNEFLQETKPNNDFLTLLARFGGEKKGRKPKESKFFFVPNPKQTLKRIPQRKRRIISLAQSLRLPRGGKESYTIEGCAFPSNSMNLSLYKPA